VDESPVSVCKFPGCAFDPSTVNFLIINDDDEKKEEYDQEKTMVEKNKDSHILNVISSNRRKQLSLYQFMQK